MNLGLALRFFVIVSLVSPHVYGQIINIEDKRTTKDTTAAFWQIDFGGNFTENTRSVLSLTAALRLDLLREKRQWLFIGSYNLVRANKDRVLNDGFSHWRYGQTLGGAWSWEVFTQIQYNRRLLIDLRALAGTGPRFQLQDREVLDLAMGMLLMYEYNELGDQPSLIFRRDYRVSTYITAQLKLSENTTLATTSYYQPLLGQFGESRLSSVNSLNIELGQRLSFNTHFSITYDGLLARLLTDVPSTSFTWRNFLRITF